MALRRRLAAVATSICATLVGCDDKVAQCNRLVDAVNPHTEAVSRAVEGLARVETEPEAADRLRSALDQAEAALAPVALDDPKLAGWLLAYRKQLAAATQATEGLAAAARASNPGLLHEAVAATDCIVAEQDALLREVNEYCAAGPS